MIFRFFRAGVIAITATVVAAVFATGAVAQVYLVRPGDTLSVSVLEDPSLDRQVLVRPDGRISLPLAGTLEVAGLSPEDVQNRVRAALRSDFINPPTVTVAVTSVSTEIADGVLADIYLIGAVNAPGRYDMLTPVTVLQALATAGGLNPFAAGDRIQVRRIVAGRDEVMLFDLDQVMDGAVPANAFRLVPGDIIVVPERGLFD